MIKITQETTFLELRLFDNGIDFINKSMESFIRAVNDHEAIEYKYAILLLATGTEIILKSILEDIHPLFIQESIDGSSDFTVKSENLVSRINKIYEFQVPKKRVTNKEKDYINSIREVRNHIIHKEVIFKDEKGPQKLYAATLFALDSIVKNFKDITLSSKVANWEFIVQIEDIQHAYYSSSHGISFSGLYIPCPFCSIKKLVHDKDSIKCLHCESTFEHIFEAVNALREDDIIEDYYQAFAQEKHAEGIHFENCSHCGTEGYSWYDKQKNNVWCFNCGIISSESCGICHNKSIITYNYELGQEIFGQNYCFVCRENPEGERCPNCFDESFMLREKIQIDIKIPKSFYSEVNLEMPKNGIFIEVSLCPECHIKMEDFETKGIIEII